MIVNRPAALHKLKGVTYGKYLVIYIKPNALRLWRKGSWTIVARTIHEIHDALEEEYGIVMIGGAPQYGHWTLTIWNGQAEERHIIYVLEVPE